MTAVARKMPEPIAKAQRKLVASLERYVAIRIKSRSRVLMRIGTIKVPRVPR